MARIVITEGDLLDALASASTAPEDARTMAQLSLETGMGVRKLTAAMHALNAAGRLRVHRVSKIALDGRRSLVPAYTILPAKKAKR